MITMMISKDADFDHKDEEGGECRVQTKVKYVAGFGQNHNNRVVSAKARGKGEGWFGLEQEERRGW